MQQEHDFKKSNINGDSALSSSVDLKRKASIMGNNDRLTSAEKTEIIRRKNTLNNPDILRNMLIKTGY